VKTCGAKFWVAGANSDVRPGQFGCLGKICV
jgi:hypothetical protein